MVLTLLVGSGLYGFHAGIAQGQTTPGGGIVVHLQPNKKLGTPNNLVFGAQVTQHLTTGGGVWDSTYVGSTPPVGCAQNYSQLLDYGQVCGRPTPGVVPLLQDLGATILRYPSGQDASAAKWEQFVLKRGLAGLACDSDGKECCYRIGYGYGDTYQCSWMEKNGSHLGTRLIDMASFSFVEFMNLVEMMGSPAQANVLVTIAESDGASPETITIFDPAKHLPDVNGNGFDMEDCESAANSIGACDLNGNESWTPFERAICWMRNYYASPSRVGNVSHWEIENEPHNPKLGHLDPRLYARAAACFLKGMKTPFITPHSSPAPQIGICLYPPGNEEGNRLLLKTLYDYGVKPDYFIAHQYFGIGGAGAEGEYKQCNTEWAETHYYRLMARARRLEETITHYNHIIQAELGAARPVAFTEYNSLNLFPCCDADSDGGTPPSYFFTRNESACSHFNTSMADALLTGDMTAVMLGMPKEVRFANFFTLMDYRPESNFQFNYTPAGITDESLYDCQANTGMLSRKETINYPIEDWDTNTPYRNIVQNSHFIQRPSALVQRALRSYLTDERRQLIAVKIDAAADAAYDLDDPDNDQDNNQWGRSYVPESSPLTVSLSWPKISVGNWPEQPDIDYYPSGTVRIDNLVVASEEETGAFALKESFNDPTLSDWTLSPACRQLAGFGAPSPTVPRLRVLYDSETRSNVLLIDLPSGNDLDLSDCLTRKVDKVVAGKRYRVSMDVKTASFDLHPVTYQGDFGYEARSGLPASPICDLCKTGTSQECCYPGFNCPAQAPPPGNPNFFNRWRCFSPASEAEIVEEHCLPSMTPLVEPCLRVGTLNAELSNDFLVPRPYRDYPQDPLNWVAHTHHPYVIHGNYALGTESDTYDNGEVIRGVTARMNMMRSNVGSYNYGSVEFNLAWSGNYRWNSFVSPLMWVPDNTLNEPSLELRKIKLDFARGGRDLDLYLDNVVALTASTPELQLREGALKKKILVAPFEESDKGIWRHIEHGGTAYVTAMATLKPGATILDPTTFHVALFNRKDNPVDVELAIDSDRYRPTAWKKGEVSITSPDPSLLSEMFAHNEEFDGSSGEMVSWADLAPFSGFPQVSLAPHSLTIVEIQNAPLISGCTNSMVQPYSSEDGLLLLLLLMAVALRCAGRRGEMNGRA
ncbi:MAG: hypothetical protein C4523_05330 [Myxococcales bacterium]|nr:MAG: hypothetical protein C4523_05330 [Myxococcales bacterium]